MTTDTVDPVAAACPDPPVGCRAAVGEPCRNLRTGEPLRRQVAHVARLQAAGVPLRPVTVDERGGSPDVCEDCGDQVLGDICDTCGGLPGVPAR